MVNKLSLDNKFDNQV